MITKMTHTSLFVTDQDKAFDFYVNKLGFKVNTDVTMPPHGCEEGKEPPPDAKMFRWLTLNAPDQPDFEIILMSTDSFEPDDKKALEHLLSKGVMGCGVFYTSNCVATYEELKAKGVEFKSEPREQFYGIECVMTDGCGNWFSMTEPKAH